MDILSITNSIPKNEYCSMIFQHKSEVFPHNGEHNNPKAVSYEEYFRQIFGGLGVLPVFWNSQERLTRNIFRKYFSPKYYSGNISQKSAPRQIFRAQIFLGQQIFSQQIFEGVAVTSKHVG